MIRSPRRRIQRHLIIPLTLPLLLTLSGCAPKAPQPIERTFAQTGSQIAEGVHQLQLAIQSATLAKVLTPEQALPAQQALVAASELGVKLGAILASVDRAADIRAAQGDIAAARALLLDLLTTFTRFALPQVPALEQASALVQSVLKLVQTLTFQLGQEVPDVP